MNVHFSYKISKTTDLEKQVKHQLEKLDKYLQVFRPDLVHIKGIVEESSAREGFIVSLNLRLPTAQMAAQEKSPVAATAVKAAFDALTEQLKRHKQVLRSKHKWVRHRDSDRHNAEIASFESTIAVVRPETVSPLDIAGYIDVNLPRLKRFAERQIAYRESLGELTPEQVAPDEVVAEAIATALSDEPEKPERIKLEPWLYRLAREAVGRVAASDSGLGEVSFEHRHGVQNVQASDEARLQFHQPDDRLLEEDIIADGHADNPEQMAVSQELIKLVQLALHGAGRPDREIFILHAVEGFSQEEIAVITNHTLEEVRASIRKARQHLQRALPIKDLFKDRTPNFTQSA
ncbi:MAG TPA: sigma-70 family RNA polymerase sigma factor [Candidatus Bathyarchaeia archaeon]|nr:sigma-70 family RNA polymerase sigma factor [Candidatus Bathyarchaeia archaeon]